MCKVVANLTATGLLAILVASPGLPELVHAKLSIDSGENPKAITVSFQSGSATFSLQGVTVQTIDVRVDDKVYSAKLRDCFLVENVRFDTATLTTFPSAPGQARFTLSFRTGTESDEGFYGPALIQISFRDGMLLSALVSRETGEHKWSSKPLCPKEGIH
jgi:hypothetical protein